MASLRRRRCTCLTGEFFCCDSKCKINLLACNRYGDIGPSLAARIGVCKSGGVSQPVLEAEVMCNIEASQTIFSGGTRCGERDGWKCEVSGYQARSWRRTSKKNVVDDDDGNGDDDDGNSDDCNDGGYDGDDGGDGGVGDDDSNGGDGGCVCIVYALM